MVHKFRQRSASRAGWRSRTFRGRPVTNGGRRWDRPRWRSSFPRSPETRGAPARRAAAPERHRGAHGGLPAAPSRCVRSRSAWSATSTRQRTSCRTSSSRSLRDRALPRRWRGSRASPKAPRRDRRRARGHGADAPLPREAQAARNPGDRREGRAMKDDLDLRDAFGRPRARSIASDAPRGGCSSPRPPRPSPRPRGRA